MERNQNIQKVEKILERVFDAKQNQPFTLMITLDGETGSKTATWSMGKHGPLITTHERLADQQSFDPEQPDPSQAKIDLPFGHSVFNALHLNSEESTRFDGARRISSSKTVSYMPGNWIEKQSDWKCDYAWFTIEGIPMLPISANVELQAFDSPLNSDPRFVVEPVTMMDWTVGEHRVHLCEHSHTHVSEPHYYGTVSRVDQSPMNKQEIETKLGVLRNAWRFATGTETRVQATVAYDRDDVTPKSVAVRGHIEYIPTDRDNWFKPYDRQAVGKVEAVANLIDNSKENVYLDQAIHCLVAAETLDEHGLTDIALTTAVNALEALCEWKQMRSNRKRRGPALAKHLEQLIAKVQLHPDDLKGTRRRLAQICQLRNGIVHARVSKVDTHDYLNMYQAFSECQWLTETVILVSATGETSGFPRQVESTNHTATLKDLIGTQGANPTSKAAPTI